MRALRADRLALCAVLALAGCSENFGVAPLGGVALTPSAEEAIGPVLPRAGLALSRTRDGVLLATDRGLYRVVDGEMPRWLPEHPGFVTDQGDASPQFLQELVSDPEAGFFLHNTAVGSGQRDHFLMFSPDAGRRYRSAGRPNALARSVDHIALSAGFRGTGALLATQNLEIHVQAVNETSWEQLRTPSSLTNIEAVGGANGRFVLGGQGATGGEIWMTASADSFERAELLDASPWLAVSLDAAGLPVAVGQSAVVRGLTRWSLAPGWVARAASISRVAGESYFAFLAVDEGGAQRLHLGRVGEAPGAGIELPEAVVWTAPMYDGTTAWLVTPGADLLRHRAGSFEVLRFAGRDLWWTALGDDPRMPGRMALGNRLTGRVHVGRRGGAWTDIRAQLLSSTARHVAAVPGTVDGFWLGSFGLYEHVGSLSAGSWETRTTGMQTYLQTGTLDLMEMSTLYHDPADPTRVWSGTTEGNGPYVSFNKGMSWERRHGGLGIPGTLGSEDGLPNATQVRAFAIDEGTTWMASFRGGVWSLANGLLWEQRNEGLPDLDGIRVEGCCYALLEREVDVRDLVVVDGALLAATPWGIYRDDAAAGIWEPSLDGLTNGDIEALAVHPLDPDWILAAARGKFDVPDWLFLSVDGGHSWRPVRSRLRSARPLEVIWSNPARNEAVAILDGRGAWWMELTP